MESNHGLFTVWLCNKQMSFMSTGTRETWLARVFMFWYRWINVTTKEGCRVQLKLPTVKKKGYFILTVVRCEFVQHFCSEQMHCLSLTLWSTYLLLLSFCILLLGLLPFCPIQLMLVKRFKISWEKKKIILCLDDEMTSTLFFRKVG